jgi:hypothetical protein
VETQYPYSSQGLHIGSVSGQKGPELVAIKTRDRTFWTTTKTKKLSLM